MVWDNSTRNRYPLAAAFSEDGCHSWSRAKVIAASPGRQASYPSVAESREGVLIAVWQQDLAGRQGREIRYAHFNRAWLLNE